VVHVLLKQLFKLEDVVKQCARDLLLPDER
jgi:hypothetical protein